MANGIQAYDAIVIGGGFSGMYMVSALRDKLGLRVRAYEAGKPSAVRGIGTAIPAPVAIPIPTFIA